MSKKVSSVALDLSLFRDDGKRKEISDLAQDLRQWIFINRTGIEAEQAMRVDRWGMRTADSEDLPITQRADSHSDHSVEVCGNRGDGDDDCNCEMECDCEECSRCDHCNTRCADCECDDCIVCYKCGDIFNDCTCYDHQPQEGCDDCKEVSKQQGADTACSSCQYELFSGNSCNECYERGNYYLDCSYECGCEIDHHCSRNYDEVDGELVSPPMLRYEMIPWVREFYGRTNSSCGEHQHFSLKMRKMYSILMDESFHEYAKERLWQWAKDMGVREGSSFYRRMRGDVQWCHDRYEAYDQINSEYKDDCRYMHVNYCWNQHKTMEVRLLPAFQDVELMVSAHKELANIIEQYCADHIDSLATRHRTITMEVMV